MIVNWLFIKYFLICTNMFNLLFSLHTVQSQVCVHYKTVMLPHMFIWKTLGFYRDTTGEQVFLVIYRECDLVLGPCSFVQGGHAIFSSEI